jgi:hypothetical protein
VPALLLGDDQPVGQGRIEVATNRRRGEPEPGREFGGGRGPQLEQQPHHAVAGALVGGIEPLRSVVRGFHNAIIA